MGKNTRDTKSGSVKMGSAAKRTKKPKKPKKKPRPDLPPEEYLTRENWRVEIQDGLFWMVRTGGSTILLPPMIGAAFLADACRRWQDDMEKRQPEDVNYDKWCGTEDGANYCKGVNQEEAWQQWGDENG